jgi:hypothetical protein
VFLAAGADEESVSRVGTLLVKTSDFKEIAFVPKGAGFSAMKNAHPHSFYQTLPYNPLPDSYKPTLLASLSPSRVSPIVRHWPPVANVTEVGCPTLAASRNSRTTLRATP